MSKCGECQVCCEVLAVKGLKSANIKCKNQCESGCSVYKSRPKGCSHFKCVWLTSDWPIEFRPDKSGVMLAGFNDEIKAYRLTEKVNNDLMDTVLKIKNVKGYDVKAMYGTN